MEAEFCSVFLSNSLWTMPEEEEVHARGLKTTSKRSYASYLAHFYAWIHQNRGLVSEDNQDVELVPKEPFVDEFEARIGELSESTSEAYEKAFKKMTRAYLVEHCDVLRTVDWLAPEDARDSAIIHFLNNVKVSKGGGVPNQGTYDSYRSALKQIWNGRVNRDCRLMPAALEREIARLYKGIKRTNTERAVAGEIDEKEPFDIHLMRELGSQLLKSSLKEAPFVHVFMLMAWNMTARAGSISDLLVQNIHIKDDALGIMLAQTKNGQNSERKKPTRHVYANPIEPELCPILALSLHLMVSGFAPNSAFVFGATGGSTVYDRFNKSFKRFITTNSTIQQILTSQGLGEDDFGAHSFRKGAIAYCLNGVHGGPSPTSIFQRSGWTLNSVEKRYAFSDSSSDQHVGRTVAGLKQGRLEFAVLPPFFKNDAPEEMVIQALASCFQNMPFSFASVGRRLLASAVYHFGFLNQTLPPNHPLRFTPLFTSRLGSDLKKHVSISEADTSLTPTGVPSMINFMQEVRCINNKVDALPQVHVDVAGRLNDMLKETPIAAGQCTPEMVLKLKECYVEQSSNMLAILERIEKQFQAPPTQTPVAAEETEEASETTLSFPWFEWGGQNHLLPEGFKLPNVKLRDAYCLWRRGAPVGTSRHHPLQVTNERDYSIKSQRRRFHDFKYLMKKIDDHPATQNLPKAMGKASIHDIGLAVEQVLKDESFLSHKTTRGRKRRVNDLKWGTAAKILRHIDADTNHEQVENNEDDDMDME